ncbi:hypothetical protein H5410_040432, partial [Solanum commersonii]
VNDVHLIYSTFKSEETCIERYLHLIHIYLENVHTIYSAFKSEETCVERYFHLNRIYLEVKDVHPSSGNYRQRPTKQLQQPRNAQFRQNPLKQ